MKHLISLFLVFGLPLSACTSGPEATASLSVSGEDGSTAEASLRGEVAWTGTGEQITASLPGGANNPSDALSLPVRIHRMGITAPDGPVIIRVGDRSWQSTPDPGAAKVTISELRFRGDAEYPWLHIGKVELVSLEPLDNNFALASATATFSLPGPSCALANPGETRCGVPWSLPDGVQVADLVEESNDCPAYVVETWIEGSTLTINALTLDGAGYESISCVNTEDGRKICGGSESDMEVGSCMWNGAIQLDSAEHLLLDGIATCGDEGSIDTCRASFAITNVRPE